MLSRPQPLFSFEPEEIKSIRIMGRDSFSGEKGVTICVFDRERVDYIIGLLNGFEIHGSEEFTTPRRCGTELSLYFKDGGPANAPYVLYFDTYSDGRPDAVSVANADKGGCVRYETAPGYFGELKKMPSSDRGELEPERPGPTAGPEG